MLKKLTYILAILGLFFYPTTLFMIYFATKEKTYFHIHLRKGDYLAILAGFVVDLAKIILVIYLL